MLDFTSFSIQPDDSGRRIDRIVRRLMPETPLSSIYRLFRKGLIRFNGQRVTPGFLVPSTGQLLIASMLLAHTPDISLDRTPEIIPDTSGIERIHETGDIVFINKPSGISVHGPDSLESLIPQSEGARESLSFRSGPLHRLDKDTSGLIAFSRSLRGARWFSHALHARQIQKYYVGIVSGFLDITARWQDVGDGQSEMVTDVHTLLAGSDSSLLCFHLITGKKHQIRIQCASHGHPLIGDKRYGATDNHKTFFLHSWKMIFPEESLPGLPHQLTASLPARFSREILDRFGDNVLALLDDRAIYWSDNEEPQ